MRGMILAAGFGTRFRPITYGVPKPMVPLCNRPLISYATEAMLRAGVDHLVVNLHHLPEPLERYLETTYGHRTRLSFSHENEILGTGGGIRKVRPLLTGEPFLLMNGDTIQQPPFAELRDARDRHDALAALTLRHPPAGDRFTKVWFENGLITAIGGEGRGEALMFSGSHIISDRLFDYLPDRDFSGITEDVYIPLLKAGTERLAGVVDDGVWFDIGTPLRYMSASVAITQLTLDGQFDVATGSHADRSTSSILADAAVIRGSVERSTIGNASIIGAGAVVTGSSVWEGCHIGEDVSLDGCIVAHGVTIKPGTRLTNALIARDDAAIPAEFLRESDLVLAPVNPAEPMQVH